MGNAGFASSTIKQVPAKEGCGLVRALIAKGPLVTITSRF